MSYRQLYLYLFKEIAKAVEELEDGNVLLALHRLIAAQQQAEEWVIQQDILPEQLEEP